MEKLKRITDATQEIRTAVERGQYRQARVLASAMRTEWPDAVEGWLWSTWLSEVPEHAVRYAEHARTLRPDPLTDKAIAWARKRLQEAQKGLATPQELDEISATMATLPPSEVPDIPQPGWFRLWDIALVVTTILLLVGGGYLWWQVAQRPAPKAAPVSAPPAIVLKREAEALWAAGRREEALTAWEEAHRLAPNVPDIVVSLARAHVALSTGHLQNNAPDEAFPHLEAAYTLLPEETAVLHEYQALKAYITGRDAIDAQEWELALEALTPLHQIDRGYLDVAHLMEVATAGRAQAAQFADNDADRAFDQARESTPGLALRTLMQPPEYSSLPGQDTFTPVPPLVRLSNKQIVVSINNQRMYVYENGQLIWNWTASTGEAERPTIPGKYRIQSKFENARSNVWELWMPYWQGLYWAGSVENGIHGQVTFDSGGRLWEGYLGTRITFGCVMISDDHAAQLFDWAEMGTPVSIHWEWDPSWVPNENGDRS
jgi:lipoprotein-anchoring transpeptidase ErfK/SrfK